MSPHPDDLRFNPDGTLKDDFLTGDPKLDAVLLWGLENIGYNEETGEVDYFGNIPGFERDMQNDGRWVKRARRRGRRPDDPNRQDRVPSPPPQPPLGGRRKPSKVDWIKYAIEFAGWAISNFGDKVFGPSGAKGGVNGER